MKIIRLLTVITFSTLILSACGGGSSGSAPPPPPPPPPPPTDMSAAGLWVGQSVIDDIADVTTSFEFDDADGFEVGTTPFTADFQGGIAESRGIGALYVDGVFSWHVAAAGTITFNGGAGTLTFSTRTVTAGDSATIQVLDVDGVEISSTVVPDAFQQVMVTRDFDGGDSLIGSVNITVAAGEIVVDALTFGYPSIAATLDTACLIAPDGEFVCINADPATGDLDSGSEGTITVSVDQVTGAGRIYALPGETIGFGSAIAEPFTIPSGTVAEGATLDLASDLNTVPIPFTSTFDDTYNRGADLATVAASYTMFDIFGDISSFDIDAAGLITGQAASGCVLSGQVSIIEAAANVYDVNLVADAATCGTLAGDYNGLGATQDENGTDDLFVFAVFVADQRMIVGEAVK